MKREIFSAVAILLASAAVPALAIVGGGDITLKSRQGDVLFSHDLHVARVGAKCQQCHDSLYTNAVQHKSVTMRQMQEGKSCGACHNGKQAFSVKADCARCHKKQGRT